MIPKKCPKCGSEYIWAEQTEYVTCLLINGEYDHTEDVTGVSDVYGPYMCFDCKYEWNE